MRELFLAQRQTSLSYDTSSETSMVKSYAPKTCTGVYLSVLVRGFKKKKLLPCDFDEITLGMVEDACTYISFDGDEVTVEDQISPSVKFRVRVGVRVREDEGEIHQNEDERER